MKKKREKIKIDKRVFFLFALSAALFFTPYFKDAFYAPKVVAAIIFLSYLIYSLGAEKILSSSLLFPSLSFLITAALVLAARGKLLFAGGNYGGMVLVLFILLIVSGSYTEGVKKGLRSALCVALFISSLYAVMQQYGLAGEFSRFAREGSSSIMPISTVGNRVYLADYIILALPFAFSFFREKKIKGGVCILTALWALYLSGASRALPGLAAITAVYICFLKGKKRRYLIFAWALLMVSGFLYFYFNFSVLSKSSLQPRFQVWRVSREIFLSSPWTGRGAGTFRYEYPLFQEKFFREEENISYAAYSQTSLPLRAQSQPVQILVETGVVGFLFIIFIFYRWYKKSDRDREFGIPALAGVSAILISSLVGFPFQRPEIIFSMALIMGVAVKPAPFKKTGSPGQGLIGKLLIALCLLMAFMKTGEQVFWEKGRRAFNDEDFKKSAALLEKAEFFSLVPGEIIFLRARAWNGAGIYHIARDEYLTALNTYRHSALYFNLALTFLRTGQYDKAEKFLQKSVYTTPKFEKAYRVLINLYLNTGRFEMAGKYKKMLMEVKGKNQ